MSPPSWRVRRDGECSKLTHRNRLDGEVRCRDYECNTLGNHLGEVYRGNVMEQ